MSALDGIRYRLRVLFGRDRYARDLDEEFRFHLSLEEMQQRHAAGRGELAGDPSATARHRFGNLTYYKEESRHMAGLEPLDAVRQDLRFAARSFRRTPGFTAVVILTLAIGIGANTAIFSAVNALLLRPLPFAQPERLMKISLTVPARPGAPAMDDMVWSYPKFLVFRQAQRAFTSLGLYARAEVTVTGAGGANRDVAELAGGAYLRTLGVRPELGRAFLPDEVERTGSRAVVLISDDLWRRRYNAERAIVGRTIDIDGSPYTVAGVLPPGFHGLSGHAELWLPILDEEPEAFTQPSSHEFTLIGRRAAGVTPDQATRAAQLIGKRVNDAYPPMGEASVWGATATSLDATRVAPAVRHTLLVLFGAVGVVLLIACANVANLLLVRAAGRQREIAVRLAVGAGRGRLRRQLLTECLLLSLLGGMAGLVVAWAGTRLLGALDPLATTRVAQTTGLGVVSAASIRLDAPTFAFALLAVVVTGLVFGLAPALQATRVSFTAALKSARTTGHGGRAPRRLTVRHIISMTEVALSVVLLVGSALVLRSLAGLFAVNPGFDAHHVLTLRLRASSPGESPDSLVQLYDRVMSRVATLPGVTGVALQDCPPLNGGCSATAIRLRDRPPVAEGTEADIGVHWVTPSWFSLVSVPLMRGRVFTPADRRGAAKVVLVSQTAARRFWPGADPIGRPVSLGVHGFWNDTAYVAGVVGDVHYGSLDSLPAPEVYLPYDQAPRPGMMVFVRTRGDPQSIAAAARHAVAEVAPDVPAFDVRTLESRAADVTAQPRFIALLLAMFAGLALMLAAVGIYGVMSFAVSQRSREIGVRVALGASRAQVVRTVLEDGMVITAVGVAVGVAVALAATRALGALLYDVTPSDPVAFAAGVAVLLAAALAACWVPARRAARMDPVEVLRGE